LGILAREYLRMKKVNVIVHPTSNFSNNRVVKHIQEKLACSFEVPEEVIGKGTVLYLPFDGYDRAFEIRQIHYTVSNITIDLNCGYCVEGLIDAGIQSKDSVRRMITSALNSGWKIHNEFVSKDTLRSVS
jgi:hypothetical protein